MRGVALGLTAALMLAGCATTVSPVEVTRFHLGEPIARGTIMVAPLGEAAPSLEYASYAAAVEQELARAGYSVAQGNLGTEFVADAGFTRANRVGGPERSPVSIGIGAGGFSGGRRSGLGLGGGLSFGIGGGKGGDIVVSELSVRIKRRQGDEVIWEGRAQTEARGSNPAAQPGIAAEKLARALFAGFPGRSGETITVK
ncbi:DUF4136 domain-containing protein [Sphingomonas gilva]|uniref:DUF4136 domain-containing protein n=1 Tax=Sphingomonas gilva TaxID=2305907 RepID=A0A396RQN8_9SPHN|nr:DUF4136 domain-containing protein [Sphingomonas gilva]RHW18808.1 DUF4136 domain-containing protein [Sphingomonas gilva]